MKIVCVSDTHSMHPGVKVPDGDVFVHSGDFTGNGSFVQMLDFALWVKGLPHKHKVVIAGNHDAICEKDHEIVASKFKEFGIHYLNDSGVEIDGVKFWGSPVSPAFMNWHFNRERGTEINEHWKLIPADTDVLITHGPPMFIRDTTTMTGGPVGCEDLLRVIKEVVKPKFHIFGHIHDGHGTEERFGTTFVNCAVLCDNYRMVYKPIVVEL